jgi:hypothetical protein
VHNPLRLPRKTTLQRPRVARTYGVLRILTWKCASRHNGVHFFDISTTKSGPWLRTRRFSPKSLEKHSVSQLSYLFAHLHLLSSESFSSTLISYKLSRLSASALLCFSSIVGSLTSKLPSTIGFGNSQKIIAKITN